MLRTTLQIVLHNRNILGDSWTCCQAPGPLLSLHSPNGGLECGLEAAVTGTQPLAVRVLQLLKPFFPLCPGKAAPRESSTQEVPVCRTLPIADIRLIYYLYIHHIYIRAPCSECCQQCGAGGHSVGWGSVWGRHRRAAQHSTLHSLLSEGSSFISLLAFPPGSSL